MIGGQWKIHRNISCYFFHTRSKRPKFFFCLKEIHSWWNCCGFWIHITITVHLIIFIANQSTFRPRKTFATFLLDARNLKMVEKINWVLFSGFSYPDSGFLCRQNFNSSKKKKKSYVIPFYFLKILLVQNNIAICCKRNEYLFSNLL